MITVKIKSGPTNDWLVFSNDKISVMESLTMMSEEIIKKNSLIMKLMNIFKNVDNLNDKIFDIDEDSSSYGLLITGEEDLLGKLIDIGIAEKIEYQQLSDDDVLSDDIEYPDEETIDVTNKLNNLFNVDSLNDEDDLEDTDENENSDVDSDECLIDNSYLKNNPVVKTLNNIKDSKNKEFKIVNPINLDSDSD